mgnify:CR=1 FL=1
MRVGKWLDQCARPEHEDRLLTGKLVPFLRADSAGAGCLGGVAFGYVRTTATSGLVMTTEWFSDDTATHFNLLCKRLHGDTRQNLQWSSVPSYYTAGAKAGILIRNRILRNRARRALSSVPVSEGVLHESAV